MPDEREEHIWKQVREANEKVATLRALIGELIKHTRHHPECPQASYRLSHTTKVCTCGLKDVLTRAKEGAKANAS
jgi:hypothetical protein